MAQQVIREKIGPRGAGPIDPHQLFKNAENFRYTVATIVGLDGDIRFAQPTIVLSAFASELFLKCLLVLETGKSPRGHELDTLFSKLKTTTQGSIEQRWNRDVLQKRKAQLDAVEKQFNTVLARDVHSALKSGSNSFAHVRYAHERRPAGNFMLMDLPNVLRSTVLDLKPEWK